MTTEKEQLKNFLLEQFKNGVPESDLRTVLKQEGGWTDADLEEVVLAVRKEMSLQTQGQNLVAESVLQATPSVPTAQPVSSNTYTTQGTFSQDALGIANAQMTIKPKTPHKLLLVGAIVFGVCVLGGVGYAFVQYSGVFSQAPYTEENLLRGLIASSATIESGTYRLEGKFAMEEREAGAYPFVLKEDSVRKVHEQAYKRDYERLDDVERILSMLRYVSRKAGVSGEQYSSSLNMLSSEYEEMSKRVTKTSETFNDPVTNVLYGYRTVQGGEDFELMVTFETSEALRAIQNSYKFDAGFTRIDGKTVTFTRTSPSYFHMPRDLPKPFLVELGEQTRFVPPEMNAVLSVEATSDFRTVATANWSFAVDSMVDFGDMTYKVALDARKIGEDYYVRVRNIPGLFLMFVGGSGFQKDVWMKISPKEMSENDAMGYSFLGSMVEELPDIEEEYKTKRKEAADFIEKVITFAEEERLIQLRSKPALEKVGDRNLYRYEIQLNFEALAPFLRKVAQEAEKNETMSKNGIATDTSLLEYLESDECKQMFEYIDANTSLVLHVDQKGYLAQVQQKTRLVPPDTATNLAEKQGNLTFTISLNNVNEKVTIEVPNGAVPIEQIMKEAEESLEFSYRSVWPEMKSLSAQVVNIWDQILSE